MTNAVYDRLAEAVQQAKGGSPLTAVTVVVPSFGASRDVLRFLAVGAGVANTRVMTVSQVVDRLAMPALSPRAAMPYPLLEAAIQRILSETPGVFVDVAEQPVTAQALAGASWALSAIADPQLADPSPMVADMLRIHSEVVRAHSGRYYVKHEAYAAALNRVAALGKVVVLSPAETEPAAAEFLARLDGEVVDCSDDVTGTMVIHASDADDEVRSVARLVRSHLAAGTPGHRIGVFYGRDDPYLQLIHEHFTRAGVQFSAPQYHSLIDRPVARSLLGLLELDIAVMPRRELLSILAERAVRWEGLKQAGAEKLTRRVVPIVGGADWERLGDVDDGFWVEQATLLVELVGALRADLSPLSQASTWADATYHMVALIDRYFRPGVDVAAVRAMAAGLGEMDGIAPPPTVRGVVDAMRVRIRTVGETVGTFGAGVAVGPIAAGVGRDLDVSIVIGCAEGIIPAVRREDPLLPSELAGEPLAAEIEQQRRRLMMTLGAGVQHRVVAFPRGSLRGGAEKVPSRWLTPTLEALAGRSVGVTSWQADSAGADAIVSVESFDAATRHADPRLGQDPATETEWRLRALAGVAAVDRQGLLDDRVIRSGMEARGDRLNGRFTRFNGNVSDARDLVTYFDRPVPPTRLEDWIASPYMFYVRHILGVDALTDPDVATALDPLTRGNLVHRVLERYVLECIGGARRSLDRLLQIADEELSNARVDAPGWLPQLWEKDIGVIRRDLVEWFAHDNREHIAGWSPTDAERVFGRENDDAVLEVGAQRIRFTGTVDRIDRHTDGRLRVTDYKTGKLEYFAGPTPAEPTVGGTKFQLPVYGLFAKSLIAGDVEARYWFVTTKGKFAEIGYPITDSVIDVLRNDVGVVHRGVTAGHFPPMPPSSIWPDPLLELIGKPGLERSWLALDNTPELADFIAIHDGDAS